MRFLRYIPGLRKRGVFTWVLAGTAKSKKRLDAPLRESTLKEWVEMSMNICTQPTSLRFRLNVRGCPMDFSMRWHRGFLWHLLPLPGFQMIWEAMGGNLCLSSVVLRL